MELSSGKMPDDVGSPFDVSHQAVRVGWWTRSSSSAGLGEGGVGGDVGLGVE